MKRKSILVLSLITCLLPALAFSQTGDAIVAGKEIALVQTDAGKVRGYIHKGILTYKGIPYAKAERFMAPAKPVAWKDIRSSMTYGPVCPMDPTTTVNDEFEFAFHHNWGYTNENCQTLNVWTPGINDNKKRAVMVWFHGGGFTAGSYVELPSYDGENISRKGAALQWIKENIAQFGGDPDNVTIFGQSGGGGKVTSLMNAPSAKGLFHKAIVESGSYLSGFTEPAISKRVAAALLAELQLQPSQVDSLQTISYERLNAAGKKALSKVAAEMKAEGKTVPQFGLGWGPILDGSFLPYQPTDAAAIEIAKNVPLLVGSTKNEFTPFIPGAKLATMDDLKANLQKQYGDKTDAYIAAVKRAYPETTNPEDYVSIDVFFRPGTISHANLKAIDGAAPVYMYLFSWQSPVNDGKYKAMHCMELPFVFNNIDKCEEMTGGGKEAYALADKMSSAWINFAKTGNPNNKKLPDWPAYTQQNGATMMFDNKCEVKNNPDKDLLSIASGAKAF